MLCPIFWSLSGRMTLSSHSDIFFSFSFLCPSLFRIWYVAFLYVSDFIPRR
nr:MAG TPA: hypothetical protein [Caudoviricetes sp.]